MKAIKSLFLAAALAAVGLAAAEAAPGHSGGAARGGNSGGHWSGGHGGGSWRGGGHWHGGRYWGPGVGFYFGAPLLWSSYYWGYPYDYYYPRTVVVDAYPQAYPQSYPEGVIESAPTTQVPPQSQGAPSQGPAYMNFCASANAYYPKVTACPEGWKFLPSR